MARNLSFSMSEVMLSSRRQPVYQILVYDLRSTSTDATPTTINDIVLENTLPAIVGPRDFTDDVMTATITEDAGDFTTKGVASATVRMDIVDRGGALDPLDGSEGRWLRQGNVIRIIEGDNQVASDEWQTTFTGLIAGQPGFRRNRTTGESTISLQAFDRASKFLKLVKTTQDFPQNTLFSDMAQSIAEDDMGLDPDEINWAGFGSNTTQFLSNQIIEESPLLGIAKIMFLDGFMPRFEGDGRLGLTTGIITKAPARSYLNDNLQISIERPIIVNDGVNEVEVVGLDPDMSQIVQGPQILASATVTLGFFSAGTEIDLYWSDDRTQQALNTSMVVMQSINGFLPVGSESYAAFAQSDGGAVGGRITVDSDYAGPAILAALTGAYIAAAWIPNTGFGVGVVTVERPGSAVQAGILVAALLLLAQYEFVFKEIRGIARVAGVRPEDRNSIVIENQFINSQSDADQAAMDVLRRKRAQQNERSIAMVHDLVLEPDDVFQTPDGRRYMIDQISRTLRRDASAVVANVKAFEVTTGVLP
jgi:hypothetical protein